MHRFHHAEAKKIKSPSLHTQGYLGVGLKDFYSKRKLN